MKDSWSEPKILSEDKRKNGHIFFLHPTHTYKNLLTPSLQARVVIFVVEKPKNRFPKNLPIRFREHQTKYETVSCRFFFNSQNHSSSWNSKQPVLYGCFNWMIPNHYIRNGCFTKHPLKNGCLGYQDGYSPENLAASFLKKWWDWKFQAFSFGTCEPLEKKAWCWLGYI